MYDYLFGPFVARPQADFNLPISCLLALLAIAAAKFHLRAIGSIAFQWHFYCAFATEFVFASIFSISFGYFRQ